MLHPKIEMYIRFTCQIIEAQNFDRKTTCMSIISGIYLCPRLGTIPPEIAATTPPDAKLITKRFPGMLQFVMFS